MSWKKVNVTDNRFVFDYNKDCTEISLPNILKTASVKDCRGKEWLAVIKNNNISVDNVTPPKLNIPNKSNTC